MGSVTKKAREIANAAAAQGESPLDFMLRVMRDETQTMELRAQMAQMAAQFCHPRINPIGPTQNGARVQQLTINFVEPERSTDALCIEAPRAD